MYKRQSRRSLKYDLYTLGADGVEGGSGEDTDVGNWMHNKKHQKGFTLIEILVVLIIIGISTTLITLNFSTLKSIDSQSNSFEKTVNFLTEESIVTGNIIGWYLNSNKQFAEYINDNKNSEIDYDFDKSILNEIASLKKTFRFEDGTLVEIEEISNEFPCHVGQRHRYRSHRSGKLQ